MLERWRGNQPPDPIADKRQSESMCAYSRCDQVSRCLSEGTMHSWCYRYNRPPHVQWHRKNSVAVHPMMAAYELIHSLTSPVSPGLNVTISNTLLPPR